MTRLVQSLFAADAASLRAAAAQVPAGVDLLEVRADAWPGDAAALAEVLPSLPRPCIVTLRRAAEQGRFTGGEDERSRFLHAVQHVAAFVDVEGDSSLARESFRPAAKIVSLHDFEGTPADLTARCLELRSQAPDAAVVKLAVTPRGGGDLLRTVQLMALSPDPALAVMAMGARGLVTRLLAGKLGSALVYGSTPGAEVTGPGQVDARTMAELYRVDRQSPGTRVCAVVGHPLGHSLSPLLHNTGYALQGIDQVYVPLEVEHLAEALELAEVCGIHGLSVTLPFKEEADRVAARPLESSTPGPAGVANTLLLQDGAWRAANTDATGFLAALRGADTGLRLVDLPCLVLGAGGVARTAVACLRQAGARVHVTSRTHARAEALARELGATAVALSAREVAASTLLVNATPVGMHPDVTRSPLPDDWLERHHVVFDLVYRPRQTALLQQAARAGARGIDGLEMFLQQGFAQYALFTGRPAPEEALRRTLVAALEDGSAGPTAAA